MMIGVSLPFSRLFMMGGISNTRVISNSVYFVGENLSALLNTVLNAILLINVSCKY